MVKPIMNLDEVEFDDVEENGLYTSSRGRISDHIGARKLASLLSATPRLMRLPRAMMQPARSPNAAQIAP